MALIPDFHVGDIGATIVLHVQEYDLINDPTGKTLVDFPLDIATLMEIHVMKPDCTVQIYTAVFAQPAEGGLGDGTDGKIKAITTTLTDLPEEGDYKAIPKMAVPGWAGYGSEVLFPVSPVF